jgi:hypothetical protein
MQTIPLWLQIAFSDWLTGQIYVDGHGNYRSRVPGRHIVAYNRSLKRLYPDNRDFHRAAHVWLALWEAVPTARLAVETRSNKSDAGRRS